MRFTAQTKLALATAVCLSAGLGTAASLVWAAGAEGEAKHTIKEVMKVAHKEGLMKKVQAGEGTQEEKIKLLDLYVSLLENEPPQGEMESWQKLAGAATMAAAKVVVGREGALEELKTATNCAACHKVHKPA